MLAARAIGTQLILIVITYSTRSCIEVAQGNERITRWALVGIRFKFGIEHIFSSRSVSLVGTFNALMI